MTEPHGYVVVDINDGDSTSEWDAYEADEWGGDDMSVRDSTVYPDLKLAREEGLGVFDGSEALYEGRRKRRIYALVPVDGAE